MSKNKGALAFKRWKTCERKHAYETEAEAFQKGQRTYKCNYCNKWHRATDIVKSLTKL